MTDDIPFAVIERFGVFRVQTGSVLQCTVDDDDDLPGQPVDPFERLGKLPGLRFRELIQRGDGHLGMRVQEFGKERGMQAGKLKRCTKSSSNLRFYEETMCCKLDSAPEPISPGATHRSSPCCVATPRSRIVDPVPHRFWFTGGLSPQDHR